MLIVARLFADSVYGLGLRMAPNTPNRSALGRRGVERNERADQAAKSAATLSPLRGTSRRFSLAFLKRRVTDRTTMRWITDTARRVRGREGNVSHWEARHPLEARHNPCSRWRDLFSKYLTPSTSYRVANTIKKNRTTVRINLCALGQLFYLCLGDFASATPGYPS